MTEAAQAVGVGGAQRVVAVDDERTLVQAVLRHAAEGHVGDHAQGAEPDAREPEERCVALG